MVATLYRSVSTLLVLTILLCGIYPLLVTGVGQLLFSEQANGSLIQKDGKTIGSKLLGQTFTKPEYFHGRPSAAGANGYDAANSSGSNLGPTNQKLFDRVKADVEKLLTENPNLKKGDVPVDLVTTSGSGLDPDISPDGALAQVERIAVARKIEIKKVLDLVQKHTESPDLGVLGMAKVNVLAINLDLDQVAPMHGGK